MKHAILILCLWLSWSSAAAQFRMIGTATWTTLTDSTYAATINFQPDLTNNGYLATQVVDGFRMFTGTEQVYTVNVNEMLSTFSSIVAVVTEYNGDHGIPIGQVMVYDPAGRATIPQAPYGNTGSTSQMQAAVDTYNARLVGTAGVDLSPYPKRTELADSAAAIRSDFPVGAGVIDSTRLTQDSILVYYQDGAEVRRDTIAGTGGVADNLGNHIMTQTLQANGNWISGDGGNEGIGIDATGKVGIGTLTPSYIIDINSTDAIRLPVGTTAQRPTGANGLLRYNSSLSRLESYYNAGWHGLSSTLADVSANSTDLASSTYTLSPSTNAKFVSSAGSDIMTISESTGSIAIGNVSSTGVTTISSGLAGSPQLSIDGKSSAANSFAGFRLLNFLNRQANFSFTNSNYSSFWRSKPDALIIETNGTGGIILNTSNSTSTIDFVTNSFATVSASVLAMRINGSGNVGIKTTSPTAGLHLPAGTATANTAPLKIPDGTLLATLEAGAFEVENGLLYYTQTTGPTRKTIAYVDTDAGSASATTDGSGDITVSHTLGSASITVTATTTGTTFYHVQVHTKTSTTFKIRFFDATGAAVTATAATADWIAKLQ